MTDVKRLPEIRLLISLQIACAASAVASVPRGLIEPLWLLAFILPSAFFLFLGTGWRRRYVPIWLRFLTAAGAQASTASWMLRIRWPTARTSATTTPRAEAQRRAA